MKPTYEERLATAQNDLLKIAARLRAVRRSAPDPSEADALAAIITEIEATAAKLNR